MNCATVATIQVGLPQTLGRDDAPDPMDRPWVTGFFKQPVEGPLWLGTTHLEGDGQAVRRAWLPPLGRCRLRPADAPA